MPSGVCQSSASRSPPGAERAAAARQAASASGSAAEGGCHGSSLGNGGITIIAVRGGDNRRPCRAPLVSLVAAVARDGGIGHRGEPARPPARGPAPLQADHPRRADRDGPQDLGVDRPAAAGADATSSSRATRPCAPKAPRRRPRSTPRSRCAGDGAARLRDRRRRDLRPRAADRRRAAADRDRRRLRRRHLLSAVGPQPLRADRAASRTRRAEGLRYAFATYKKLT